MGALTLGARDPSGVFLAGVALVRRSSRAAFKTGSAVVFEIPRDGGRDSDGTGVAPPLDLVTFDCTAAAGFCDSDESTLILGALSGASGIEVSVGDDSLSLFRRLAVLRVGRLSPSSCGPASSGAGGLFVSGFRFFNDRLGLSAAEDS